MFQKTRVRLVALNSIIFFLILALFGATVYFYMQHSLSEQADMNMRQAESHLVREHLGDLFNNKVQERDIDRRIVYLLYDEHGKLVKQVPEETGFSNADLGLLQPKLSAGTDYQDRTVTLDGHQYRVVNLKTNIPPQAGICTVPIQTFQLIANFDAETHMLHHLLYVLLGVICGGALAAFLAGLFLANRALVPIQFAWNKQQKFVADASHELRTPLAVVQVHLERLFRHPDHTIEDESENIFASIQETKRMSKLVADLLTIARSDSNELQMLHGQIELVDILEHVTSQMTQLAQQKGIALATDLPAQLEIIGDKERLHQLFVILLDNAVKYTDRGGRVTIKGSRSTQAVQVEIQDTGRGIPAEDLPFIFDRFFRGDKTRNRNDEGTGLGLSIAKWIVEAHGGRIHAASEPDKGTTISLTLPIRGRS